MFNIQINFAKVINSICMHNAHTVIILKANAKINTVKLMNGGFDSLNP